MKSQVSFEGGSPSVDCEKCGKAMEYNGIDPQDINQKMSFTCVCGNTYSE